jgi:predicted nucleic acid-binding OB-fold protein
MDLGGKLEVLDPSMVFQIVSLSGLSGKLKIITPDNVASFFFREGGLLYATIDTRKMKLGEFLVDKGHITADQLDDALEKSRSKGEKRRIGNILVDHGYLDFETLEKAIRDQIKEVVYEVIPWQRGEFVFFNRVEPKDEDILLDIRMDHLILEGLKRMDEAGKG